MNLIYVHQNAVQKSQCLHHTQQSIRAEHEMVDTITRVECNMMFWCGRYHCHSTQRTQYNITQWSAETKHAQFVCRYLD
jgi:hypothetical protein